MEQAVVMSANQPGKDAESQAGLSFANTLRDCLVCGVIIIGRNRKVTTLSPEAAHILGLNPSQVLNAPIEVLPQPLREIVCEALSSGEPIADRQFEMSGAGRGTLTLRVSAVPVGFGKNDSGVALVVNNPTLALHLGAHLEQLDRLASIGTLAASMAHEIKNALVAGKTFVDLLLEKNQEAELVEIVRRELGRIDSIVKGILRFAAPARSGYSKVRVHEVLDHSLRLVQHQLDGRSISLERSFQATPDLVSGDDCELEQAFVNLLLNALDAMGSNGTLTVATAMVLADGVPAAMHPHNEPLQLRVTIRDTGPGIPAEARDRLFEPFFTTKPTGTGLGLPITRRIIQQHDGHISVESQPGQGATFSIVLPALHDPDGEPEPSIRNSGPAPDTRSQRL